MKKKCSMPGCGRKVHAKELCQGHYRRLKEGRPLRGPIAPVVRGSAAERLKAYAEIEPETGCHLWTGFRNANGYGLMRVGERNVPVHRLAWELAHGPIPAGMLVLHTCDNRRCCNPDHLKLGTHAENARERVERKRTKGCGEEDLKRHPRWADPLGALPRETSTKRREDFPPRAEAARPVQPEDRAREGPA